MIAPARVMITGAAGQIGRELLRASWPPGTALMPFDSRGLDITDPAAVAAAVAAVEPDVIVNAAAYTAVDRAEAEPDRAMAVNGRAVLDLAAAADRVDAMLFHFSTDYVFDGHKRAWYVETDRPSPVSAYGRSKLAGEQAAGRATRSVVLRTSWVYGALGANFVAAMLRLAAEGIEPAVVDDQFGCPTSAVDLAGVVVALVEATDGGRRPTPRSLYNVAAPDDASWHELATAVFESSSAELTAPVRPIATADYPAAATRPANSRLDSSALAEDLGLRLRSWRRALPAVVAELEEIAEKSRNSSVERSWIADEGRYEPDPQSIARRPGAASCQTSSVNRPGLPAVP